MSTESIASDYIAEAERLANIRMATLVGVSEDLERLCPSDSFKVGSILIPTRVLNEARAEGPYGSSYAACYDFPTQVFERQDNREHVAVARRICAICPLWKICQDYEVAKGNPSRGVRAGQTQLERKVDLKPELPRQNPQSRLHNR